MCKVRYAPSPSGKLHLGSLKSILYNYYFAKKNNGDFYIRIEDTDKKKVTEESINNIFNTLKSLNIQYNNNVIFQSKRLEVYKKLALDLVNKNLAFYCQCKEKENASTDINRCDCKVTSGCIKIKVPENLILKINDEVYGEVELNSNKIPSFVILREDETPTYNFAVVVDDNFMNITHVIRGVEHLLNSHKQLIIYKAFNWKVPIFCHFPVIIGEDKKKLSKSRLDISIEELLADGFEVDSLKNYTMSLGSNIGIVNSEQEIIDNFDLKKIKKSPTIFTREKLSYYSKEYLKRFTDKTIENFYKYAKIDVIDKNILKEFFLRSQTYKDVILQTEFLRQKHVYREKLPIETINNIIKNLKALEWTKIHIDKYLKDNDQSEMSKIFRKVILGKESGPNIVDIFVFLGKENIIDRFTIYRDWLL